MKNSPCATFTTRITPKVRLRPTAASARTAAITMPSSVASINKGPVPIGVLSVGGAAPAPPQYQKVCAV